MQGLSEPLGTRFAHDNSPHLDWVDASIWILLAALFFRSYLLRREQGVNVQLKGEAKSHGSIEVCINEVLPVGIIHLFARSGDPPNYFKKFGPDWIDFEGKEGPFEVIGFMSIPASRRTSKCYCLMLMQQRTARTWLVGFFGVGGAPFGVLFGSPCFFLADSANFGCFWTVYPWKYMEYTCWGGFLVVFHRSVIGFSTPPRRFEDRTLIFEEVVNFHQTSDVWHAHLDGSGGFDVDV